MPIKLFERKRRQPRDQATPGGLTLEEIQARIANLPDGLYVHYSHVLISENRLTPSSESLQAYQDKSRR